MKCSGILHISLASVIFLTFVVCPAHAGVVLLSMQQEFTLENCTLQIVDADFLQDRVWLNAFADQKPPQSFVYAVGDKFRCGKLNLKVLRIYAGEDTNLVAIEILDEKM